jgi:hypothetical protein
MLPAKPIYRSSAGKSGYLSAEGSRIYEAPTGNIIKNLKASLRSLLTWMKTKDIWLMYKVYLMRHFVWDSAQKAKTQLSTLAKKRITKNTCVNNATDRRDDQRFNWMRTRPIPRIYKSDAHALMITTFTTSCIVCCKTSERSPSKLDSTLSPLYPFFFKIYCVTQFVPNFIYR